MTFDENLAVTSSYARDTLLESLRADAPPRQVVFRAWAEAYMSHAFHHCPVLDQRDMSDSPPSVVLQKAISMVANLMRHDLQAPKVATELYERIKILICMNSEPNPVQTLKILCLLSFWSCRPSTPVSVDGPWHWTGVGLRLAVQLGLCRESTYLNRPEASCLRKIFWYLRVNEISIFMTVLLFGDSTILTSRARTAKAYTSLVGATLHTYGLEISTSSSPR